MQKRLRLEDPLTLLESEPVSSPEGSCHDSDDDLVLSEVHIHPTNGRVDGRMITSVFHLNSTAQDLNQDPGIEPESAEDTFWDYAVDIQHAMGTTLGGVGSQVWMGCFLLVDWMVSIKDELSGSVALELGAGTGLASIALRLATQLDKIFCTDYGEEVLSNCKQNVSRNSRPLCSEQQTSHRLDEHILVRKYNWLMDDPRSPTDGPLDQFNWTAEECEEWRSKGAFVFGADVVYDDSLTDALIESLEKLLLEPLPESHPRHAVGRVAYLSMEKRYLSNTPLP
ncbi:hypothetical protein EDD21DRAFT_374831 [Dissophora ornata]|nr:hypothetical protein EDD21DRAFT_374831 [Dissophora ornata]